MSYMEVPHNFFEVVENLDLGSSELISLCDFFQGIKKAYDSFALELNKVSDNFNTLKPESSLTKSLNSLKMYFKQLVSHQLSFLTNLQSDIIEPLSLFLEHFNTNNTELREKGENLTRPLKILQNELSKSRKYYYHYSEQVEKLERTLQNSNNSSQIALQKKNYNTFIKQNLEKYLRCVEDLNKYNKLYQEKMPGIMECLQQNEESRICFIKSSAEKYTRFYSKNLEASLNSLNEFSSSLAFVNSNFDIKNFVGRLESPSVVKEEFVEYHF